MIAGGSELSSFAAEARFRRPLAGAEQQDCGESAGVQKSGILSGRNHVHVPVFWMRSSGSVNEHSVPTPDPSERIETLPSSDSMR